MKQHVKTTNIGAVSAAIMALFATNANAFDCSSVPAWNANQAYVKGDTVKQSQQAFEAKWWTKDSPVENSGPWDSWKKLADCDSAVNTPPTINNLLPESNSQFTLNDSVAISVFANDSDGQVEQVEFFVNGNSIGIDNTADSQEDSR